MQNSELKSLTRSLSILDESLDLSQIKAIPTRDRVISLLDSFISLIFPFLSVGDDGLEDRAEELFLKLQAILSPICSRATTDTSDRLAICIISDLPYVKEALIKDALAIYEGDPAAASPLEVMVCYPGFLAITVHRIAHSFYVRKIPYLPRMMTEYAHERTGIDIHPGARIGDSFCIDHGTGVVIGETAEIGSRVKLYQGVTIGAKSFERDGNGRLIKGKKRHPTIGNDCIIYAGATILGGDTVIGDGCVVGGNVWLTHSLSPGERVYYSSPDNKK